MSAPVRSAARTLGIHSTTRFAFNRTMAEKASVAKQQWPRVSVTRHTTGWLRRLGSPGDLIHLYWASPIKDFPFLLACRTLLGNKLCLKAPFQNRPWNERAGKRFFTSVMTYRRIKKPHSLTCKPRECRSHGSYWGLDVRLSISVVRSGVIDWLSAKSRILLCKKCECQVVNLALLRAST